MNKKETLKPVEPNYVERFELFIKKQNNSFSYEDGFDLNLQSFSEENKTASSIVLNTLPDIILPETHPRGLYVETKRCLIAHSIHKKILRSMNPLLTTKIDGVLTNEYVPRRMSFNNKQGGNSPGKITETSNRWVPSTGDNNLCGFASLVLPFNMAIIKPDVFYKNGIMPNRTLRFKELYMNTLNFDLNRLTMITLDANRNIYNNERMYDMQHVCAPALKTAFVNYMLEDDSNNSPFYNIFAMAVLECLKEEASELKDYLDYFEVFFKIDANKKILNETYLDYKNQVDVSMATYELTDEDRKDMAAEKTIKPDLNEEQFIRNIWDNRYEQSERFLDYLMNSKPEFFNEIKKHYCFSLRLDSYMAREKDIIYIAALAGFKSLEIIHDGGRKTLVPTCIDGNVEILLKNEHLHWVAAPWDRIAIIAKPEVNLNLQSSRAAAITPVFRQTTANIRSNINRPIDDSFSGLKRGFLLTLKTPKSIVVNFGSKQPAATAKKTSPPLKAELDDVYIGKPRISIDPATQSTEQLLTCSTLGEGDCAFHAVLGLWDEDSAKFVCMDVLAQRKTVGKAIRACKHGDTIYMAVKEAIQQHIISNSVYIGKELKAAIDVENIFLKNNLALTNNLRQNFENELENHPKILGYIKDNIPQEKNTLDFKDKFWHCLSKDKGKLQGLIDSIPKLQEMNKEYNDETHKSIDLDGLLEKQGVLDEYAALMEQASATHGSAAYWVWASELDIIARVFNLSIELYIDERTDGLETGNITKIETYNPGHKVSKVYFYKENLHYEKIVHGANFILKNQDYSPTSSQSQTDNNHQIRNEWQEKIKEKWSKPTLTELQQSIHKQKMTLLIELRMCYGNSFKSSIYKENLARVRDYEKNLSVFINKNKQLERYISINNVEKILSKNSNYNHKDEIQINNFKALYMATHKMLDIFTKVDHITQLELFENLITTIIDNITFTREHIFVQNMIENDESKNLFLSVGSGRNAQQILPLCSHSTADLTSEHVSVYNFDRAILPLKSNILVKLTANFHEKVTPILFDIDILFPSEDMSLAIPHNIDFEDKNQQKLEAKNLEIVKDYASILINDR